MFRGGHAEKRWDGTAQTRGAGQGAGFLRRWRQFKRKTIHGVAGLYRTASAYVFRLVLPAVSGEQQRTENAGASLATGLHLMRPIASRPRLRAFWR